MDSGIHVGLGGWVRGHWILEIRRHRIVEISDSQ